MTIDTNFPTDPTGHLAELQDAMSDPLLDGVSATGDAEPLSAQAAYRVAVAFGYCRLYGLDAGELDGSLPGHLALAAARRLVQLLPEWVRAAGQLGSSWDDRGNADEADDLVAGFVEGRTNVWAAELALGEALTVLTEDGDSLASVVAAELDQAEALIRAFNDALEPHAAILATLVETPRWSGWRAALAEEYRDPFPWWLGEPVLEAAERLRGPRVMVVELDNRTAGSSRPYRPEIAPMAMAANRLSKATPGQTWVFVHPNGQYHAKFRLPAEMTHGEGQRERPLHFLRADTQPATELRDQPFTFGSRSGKVPADARFLIKLAELPQDEPITLFVNGVEWEYRPEKSDEQS